MRAVIKCVKGSIQSKSERLSSNTDRQEVGRCRTVGESEEFIGCRWLIHVLAVTVMSKELSLSRFTNGINAKEMIFLYFSL